MPRRVLDVGRDEGADAGWLTIRGWDVTGLEASGVALGRALLAAVAPGGVLLLVHHAGMELRPACGPSHSGGFAWASTRSYTTAASTPPSTGPSR